MLYQRILITGANGLLGQELVQQMSRWPEYDILATGLDDRPRFKGASCGYVKLDITDSIEVRRLFQDFAPSVVINAAALTQVDQCEENREACWRVNVEAVETLARCCRASGARLVQVSTDFVYDGQAGPYRESDRPNPINYYGKSKLAGENAARGAGTDRWAIARTVLVFGTGESLSRSNLVLWVLDSLSQGKKIRVVADQWRTPTYVVDLAAGIDRIVRYGKTGLYHLSGREYLTVYDIAQAVARTFDLDATLIQPTDKTKFQEAVPRPLKTGFIVLKAETELGYKPRTLETALRHLGVRLGLPVATP